MNRWILEMREYNYNIQFIKGKHNYVADHLSRPVQIISRTTETTWLGLDKEAFQIKQREEPVWKELVSYLEGGKLPTKRLPKNTLDQFALQDGLLYFVREGTDGSLQFNIIVPRSLITKAIQHAHELSGHLGQKKTIKKAEELYYWVNLKVDVSKCVKECISCQRFKGEKG